MKSSIISDGVVNSSRARFLGRGVGGADGEGATGAAGNAKGGAEGGGGDGRASMSLAGDDGNNDRARLSITLLAQSLSLESGIASTVVSADATAATEVSSTFLVMVVLSAAGTRMASSMSPRSDKHKIIEVRQVKSC